MSDGMTEAANAARADEAFRAFLITLIDYLYDRVARDQVEAAIDDCASAMRSKTFRQKWRVRVEKLENRDLVTWSRVIASGDAIYLKDGDRYVTAGEILKRLSPFADAHPLSFSMGNNSIHDVRGLSRIISSITGTGMILAGRGPTSRTLPGDYMLMLTPRALREIAKSPLIYLSSDTRSDDDIREENQSRNTRKPKKSKVQK